MIYNQRRYICSNQTKPEIHPRLADPAKIAKYSGKSVRPKKLLNISRAKKETSQKDKLYKNNLKNMIFFIRSAKLI